MEYFTREEIEDIDAVYRSFCGDGRVLTDLEKNIMRKLKGWLNELAAPLQKMSLEEFKEKFRKKPHPDIKPW